MQYAVAIDVERCFKMWDRLSRLSEAGVAEADGSVRGQQRGIELQRLLEIRHGLLDLLGLQEAVADEEVEVCGVGLGVQKLLEFRERVFVVLAEEERGGQFVPRIHVVRRTLQNGAPFLG